MRVVALGMVLCGLAFISTSDRSFGQQDLRQQPKPQRTLENLIKEPAAEAPPAKEAVANADLLAVPPEAEVAATINLIRDAYSNEYKGEPSVLMKTLKSAADQTDDAVRKFALLQEAEKEAVSSGDLSQAFEFLEKRGSLFKIDVQQSSIALIKEFPNPTGEMRKKLIEKLLQLSRTAFEADQFPFAKEAVELSLVLAEKQFKKTKGDGLDLRNELLALRNEALALQKDISQRSELFGDYEKALATLKKADAGACEREHTVVGRYLCFAKDDWKEGVAYLAKGEVGSLQEAASKEVLQKSEGEKLSKDLLAVASVWWELSEKPVRAKTSLSDRDLDELEKIREHSSSIYLEALPNLIDPIDRALATKRSIRPEAPGPIFRKPINSIGLELVSIPKGTFLMGEGNRAVNVILTKPFLLGKYEVTQGQWKKVMSLEPWVGQESVQIGDDIAASYVTWSAATDFCKRLTDIDHKNGKLPTGESYRLPTESEWEYACRVGKKTAFSFGNDPKQLEQYGWFDGNAKNVGQGFAHKVGLKKPNPWGLHDMHGNVLEWCSDWYDEKLSGGIDPVGPDGGSNRVGRGGGWRFNPGDCRSALRCSNVPSFRYDDLGFRVARSQSETVTRPVMEKTEPVRKVFKSGESVTNSIGMKLIGIPAGTFIMGDGAGVAVTLTQSFGLGKYEVTQGEWMQVMTWQKWSGKANVAIGDKFPATYVSWIDATEFCEKLTNLERKAGKMKANEEYRLPTEAEWEYTCRAGTTTAFSFGDDEKQLGEYAWFDGNAKNAGEEYAHKVGMKKPNPWGLHDMHGNVWEFCSDWYGGALSGGIDPVGPGGGSRRVLRGGSWGNYPGDCRSATRSDNDDFLPSGRDNLRGFRVARSQSVQ